MAFIFGKKRFHFPIFVRKKSAGHFEIHRSIIFVDKFMKIRQKRHELLRACKPIQLPSSCFTSTAFLLRKIMFLELIINGAKSS